ncbi:hypothetical protein KPL35_17575 [Clostridium sp. CF011]|uniref:hypothetical protein n=1 Tax=Clostridium sp. CF011 TaxID=2843318 RepID=UPI001C0D7D63|nr:hypothetical protein [Clostridium sp. CF011]MBU3093844.1 hypothetical protein [Clostridium sp. CF011]WAG71767.1 hypothetical protein LL036_18905 [Clostridium sp. CF011]
MKKGIKVGRKKILFIEELKNMKLFHQKNFSLLMMAKLVSILGTQMQYFALSLYILKKTDLATLFDSVIVIRVIPQRLLTPLTGVQ